MGVVEGVDLFGLVVLELGQVELEIGGSILLKT